MKNRFKQVLAMVLILTMTVAAFAGCKPKEETENPATTVSTSDYVYLPTYVELPKDVANMNSPCIIGDTIYFLAYVTVGPDGNIIPQEEIDAYYKQWEEYYAAAEGESTQSLDGQAESPADEPAASEDVSAAAPLDEPPAMEFTSEYRLCAVNTDGTNFRYLLDYSQAEDVSSDDGEYRGSSYITGMKADAEGNLWALENVSRIIYDLPSDFDYETGNMWDYYSGEENTFYIRKLSATGEELARINLNDAIDDAGDREYLYMYRFEVDTTGNIYFDDGEKTLYVLDSNGTMLAKLTVDNWINGYISLSDGSVMAAVYNSEGKLEFREIDLAAKAWGKSYEAGSSGHNFISGNGEYDFFYNNGTSLFGYDLETATETKVLTWLNCDIDGNGLALCSVKEDGGIFVATNNYTSSNSSMEAVNLVKTPASEAPYREVITLATLGLDYSLRGAILSFNKTNQDCRIEVQDYSEYNTQDDYTAGITKLSTEIVSGKIPDIIATSQLPYEQYAAKGLLEDLYQYIDNDPDISRDDLVESVFSAMENEGKLNTIASSFYVIFIAGRADVVGSEPGWTMEEFQNVIKSHPEADYPLGMGMTRENVFSSLFTLSMSNYVNWITGECSFNTPEFKSLLEFAKTFPSYEEMDYENMEWISESQLLSEGRMIASFTGLSDFSNYQYYKAVYGGDMVIKSLPGESGGGYTAMVEGGLAMTTSCKNKDMAWSFMRTLLFEKYQEENVWSFPTNKNVFNKMLEEAMKQEYDFEGNPISRGGMSDGVVSVDYYAISQEEADQIMGLINSINQIANYETSLTQIIDEEAVAYFAGEKSLDEVASLIQSRLTIYINERR